MGQPKRQAVKSAPYQGSSFMNLPKRQILIDSFSLHNLIIVLLFGLVIVEPLINK